MKFKKEKIGEDNDFFSMALDAAVQETQDHKKKKKHQVLRIVCPCPLLYNGPLPSLHIPTLAHH